MSSGAGLKSLANRTYPKQCQWRSRRSGCGRAHGLVAIERLVDNKHVHFRLTTMEAPDDRAHD